MTQFCIDFNHFENRSSKQLHSYFLPCYKPIVNRYKFILFLELACQKRGVIMDVLHFHRRLVPDRRATSLTFGFVSFSDFLRVWKISSLSFCRRGSLVLELLSSSFLFVSVRKETAAVPHRTGWELRVICELCRASCLHSWGMQAGYTACAITDMLQQASSISIHQSRSHCMCHVLVQARDHCSHQGCYLVKCELQNQPWVDSGIRKEFRRPEMNLGQPVGIRRAVLVQALHACEYVRICTV